MARWLCLLLALAVSFGTIGADLRSDLREFAQLLPRRRIGYIAARHLILDQGFRQGLAYLRSPEFAANWRRARATPEFREIVAYLTESGKVYDVTSVIDRVPNRLKAFRIPSKVPVDMMLARDLGSFMQEVVRALPKARIAALMAEKVQEGGEFARFYAALRQDEFRRLIDQARNSSNLAEPIQRLTAHSINLDEFIDIGFELLKWGPAHSSARRNLEVFK